MHPGEEGRIVMTLDAGGTNFVFSAIQRGKEILNPVRLPSNAHNLDLCLETMILGFNKVLDSLSKKPVAISFAFPGPADYPNGIIGDLPNLPAFRGGVAIGPMLEKVFNLPVFINNDGNLFAYGEAIAGYLPYINDLLEESGSPKRFRNLVGFTLGTGFGAGIVLNGDLLIGDNSSAAEAWLLRNMENIKTNIEESISIRAIKNAYIEKAGLDSGIAPEPKEIAEIASGLKKGNQNAAVYSFKKMGAALGEAIATVNTLVDGLVVLGGGISAAYPVFLDAAVNAMNSSFYTNGDAFPRLLMKVFNLEDKNDLDKFVKGDSKMIIIPHTDEKILYDPLIRTGIGISRLGTSKAVSIGAYAYAIRKLDS